MATYHLHNWSVGVSSEDAFSAPEQGAKRLHGCRCEDDLEVTTSVIVSVNGREITTSSGSIYILEEIDPEYLNWMKENNISYDEENPVKIKIIK